MKVGVTGGMGCGKSTVAALLERAGFRRLDSDRIVRETVLVDAEVVAALRERFGAGILDLGGRVDRAALATRVFPDDGARRWLEELVHPRVYAAWRAAFAGETGGRWVVEVPLLFEQGLENWFDFTICVALSPAQQLARLEQRGIPRALAGQRISKQLPLARKIELSDFVLWNDGSAAFLEAQTARLIDALQAA
jgi:dephospho-CoA kinase